MGAFIGFGQQRVILKLAVWALLVHTVYQITKTAFSYQWLSYFAAAVSIFILLRGGKLRIFHLITTLVVMLDLRFWTWAENVSLLLYYFSFILLLAPSLKRLNRRIWAREAANKVDPTDSSTFYQSHAWRRIRLKVFERYGRQCLVPGCGEEATHIDHIKPRSKFPHLALDIRNLQPLCSGCNRAKSNDIVVDFKQGAAV